VARVTAFVMVKTEGRRASEVARRVAEIEGVAEVYSVTGDYDLIAILHVPEYERIAEIVPDKIGMLEGITHTTTIMAFRSYTKSELDVAWDIGLS
jgi:DNA-binding Lrp family transcriptional regulator